MRILLSAFVCDPTQGSEEGVGWAWAYHLAHSGHDVCVLTRREHRKVLEERVAQRGPSNLRFEYVSVPVVPFWIPVLGCYPHYFLWQWIAYLRARDLHRQSPFEVVHHVTYAVFRNPSYLYLLGVPFIFGPVGGGESSPHSLRRSMSNRGRFVEAVRDLINELPRFDPFWRCMMRKCARIVVKTEETRACLPSDSKERTVLSLENMMMIPPYLAGDIDRDPCLRLLYAGRLLPWKGVHLAVEALARVRNDVSASLTIIGSGQEELRLRNDVQRLELEGTIKFTPWMPKEEFQRMYANHDALLFPSLHDSGGTVVMESLAHGKPVICLDLGGPAVTVDQYCARVVSTKRKTEEEVIEGIAEAIRELARMPAQAWNEMRYKAVRRAQFFDPEQVIERVYGTLLKPVEATR